MVATMSQAASSSYYLECQRSFRHPTEYYTAGQEPDGVWFNPNALLDLDDARKIDSKDFHRLYNGFHPETGEKLTQNAGSENRSPGLDITFSADKSVSALWAIAGESLRNSIEEAHNNAARTALQQIFVKECSYTRTRLGSSRTDSEIQVLPAHMLGAMFQHGTSRADDPQLHTHCVIFNAVQTEQDGKWRALHQKPLYDWIKAAGAYYRAFLASNLAELGIQMERYGKDNAYVRVKNMPKDLEKMWSKRRSDIVDTAAQMGFETGDNSNRATMVNVMTRDSKRVDQEPEERFARWREECQKRYECATLLASAFGEPESVSQERIREWAEGLDELPQQLTRLQAVFRAPDLAEAVGNLHDTTLGTLHPETIEAAIQRILRNPDLVALDRQSRTAESIAGLSHTVPLSTRHTLQMEQETRDLAEAMSQKSAFALPASAIEEKLEELQADGYPLSDEQTAAIRYVTGRPGGISIVEGAAGSGKTTTMRPIVDLYKQHGYNLTATAIAWRTAVELANDCDIPPLSTDKLLKDADRGKLHLDEKSIIVVEEAGMISTRHTHRLLKLAEQSGAKVIFLGDTQQQQPIEAGPGLRLVHDVAGSHRVDTMRRQLPDAEDILRDVHGLDPDDAVAQAARLTPAQEREVFRCFDIDDPQLPVTPWQITASRDFKDGNAKDAIEAYRKRGRIHFRSSPEATVDRLVDDWHRYVTENEGKSCVVLARTHQEIKLLSLKMRERIHAGQENQKSAVVTVSRGEGKKRESYDLEIRTGDVLRVGASIVDKKVYTGSLLTVEDLSVRGAPAHHEPRVFIVARDQTGRLLGFYHDEIRDFYGNIRLDHGFALTMTSAQGLTVDRSFVLTDDAPARETIYPAATRHRDRLDFYISREGPLAKIKGNLPDQGADLQEPIGDEDIIEHLAKRWSRHQPKEAATDYTSEELMRETLESLQRAPRPARAKGDPDDAGPPSPAPDGQPARQAAVNDNSHTLFSWATRQLRNAALDLRYGNTVAMVSQGRREVMESYEHLEARARKEGAGRAESAQFDNTLFRQAQVLRAAEPFRRDPERFRDLLRKRGSLDPQDLEDFADRYARAKKARQAAAQPASREAALSEAARDGADTPAEEPADVPLPEHAARRQSRSLPRASELSAQLAECAEDVCRHYLPAGSRNGNIWQAQGMGAGADGASLQVLVAGHNRGKWSDRSAGARGDLLDLVRHVRGYGSMGEAMKDATAFLDPAAATRSLAAPSTAPEERAEAAARRAKALYESARPITAEDPAGRYFARRGLGIEHAGRLRYHERVYYLHHDDLRQAHAILAPLTGADGRLQALERILITADGDALPVDRHAIKSHSNTPADGATWFGERDASHVALCRSIPDALALLRVLDAGEREQLAVAAMPEGCDPARISISPETRRVFLVQPAGAEADDAFAALQSGHGSSDLRLRHIATGNTDLHTPLQASGAREVRSVLAPLTEALGEREDLAALKRFTQDWGRHAGRAAAARAHPFYVPLHGELVERLRALRDRPGVAALPAAELAPLDAILREDAQQAEALATVKRYMEEIQTLRLDPPQISPDHWRDAAERLLAQAHAIDRDPDTYGACLDHARRAWHDVETGIRELTAALGHPGDSLRHRHPELRLPPIPRAFAVAEDALAADATYRLLRDRWHEHLELSDARSLHPSDLPDTPSAIDAMRELRSRPGLHPVARQGLDGLLAHHDGYVQTRDGIALFRKDWQKHLDLAEAAHAHPCYIDGHAELLERLRVLLEHPAAAAFPAPELQPLPAVLDQAHRQAEALSTVESYIARLEPCLDELLQLERAARRQGAPLDSLPSYAGWRDTAEPLLDQGESIARDRDTYGPCLDHTRQAWNHIHDGIRDLADALDRQPDSLLHSEPELFLEPVTRSPIFLDQPEQDDADYRRLAGRWHALLALAEEHNIHPFLIDDCDALVDAMRDLRERSQLGVGARPSLDRIVARHGQFHVDRARVHLHLEGTERAVSRLDIFKEISAAFGEHDIKVESLDGYPDWKESAAELLHSGQDILAHRERYGIHLKEHPAHAERIRANIRTLDAQLNPKPAPPPRQQPQEDIKQTETQTQTIRRSRGIRP